MYTSIYIWHLRQDVPLVLSHPVPSHPVLYGPIGGCWCWAGTIGPHGPSMYTSICMASQARCPPCPIPSHLIPPCMGQLVAIGAGLRQLVHMVHQCIQEYIWHLRQDVPLVPSRPVQTPRGLRTCSCPVHCFSCSVFRRQDLSPTEHRICRSDTHSKSMWCPSTLDTCQDSCMRVRLLDSWL